MRHTATKACGLTCTLDLLQPEHSLPPLVQTCTVRCALGGISNACGTRGRHRFVEAPRLFILSLISFVPISFAPLLFSLTGWVMRPAIFVGTAAWFADLYVMYWREKGIRRYKRIEDEIICYLMEDGTSKSTPSVSIEISGVGVLRVTPSFWACRACWGRCTPHEW